MQSYKELEVWQLSIELVVEIYKITASFPSEERFGLVSQMRRSSVSISSNIAEGFARRNRAENRHFVSISFGSATELETQIIIARRVGFIGSEKLTADELLDRVLRMLYRYRESLSDPR